MIVDSSAIVAVLNNEPEAERFLRALANESAVVMSAGTYVECAVVIDGKRDGGLSARFDNLLEALSISIESVTPEQAKLARRAYRQYGKGSGHKARLNFGDCFAYALAIETNRPLLFKGEDFTQTDVWSAL
jgi:ribonuclease VapC